jgi:hypothetical protein
MEENPFVLQVVCLGDSKRAMFEGTLNFRQMGVILEPYSRIADPSQVLLDHINVWCKSEVFTFVLERINSEGHTCSYWRSSLCPWYEGY